jgi:DNA-directed RNA polymerase subunit M/transcription elongation factor TFIIS
MIFRDIQKLLFLKNMDAFQDIINSLLDQMSEDKSEDKLWLLSQVQEDLEEENNPERIEDYIENVIKKNNLGWEHESFHKLKQSQNEQDDYILNPFEAVEGVVECNKCGSSKVYSVSVQTRAADEPMTTMAQCTICKSKWSYSG